MTRPTTARPAAKPIGALNGTTYHCGAVYFGFHPANNSYGRSLNMTTLKEFDTRLDYHD
jgi:hypothetical protein